jgi:DNA invertase Pin-like site-specific DNA recombinase
MGGEGIEHAKARETAYRGRKPSYTRSQYEMVRDMLNQEVGISTISKVTGLSRQTIYRIEEDPVGSEAALVSWNL